MNRQDWIDLLFAQLKIVDASSKKFTCFLPRFDLPKFALKKTPFELEKFRS